MSDELQIRPMTEDEAYALVGWAADEGWNPGHHDARLFWQAAPEAFVAAELDGELVGGGAIPAYGDEAGFMGLFIMRPAFRGRGLGRALWYARRDLLRERLAPGAPIGMDGVEAMEAFYARGGFVKSHQNRRFQFTAKPHDGPRVGRPADALPFEALAAFDRRHFPGPRDTFLRAWIEQDGATALVTLDGDRITGFGVLRPCGTGAKVGPLYAEDVQIADALLRELAATQPGEPVFLDIPDTTSDGRALVERHGMEEVFSCARMWLGTPPWLADDEIFGITTFEFG